MCITGYVGSGTHWESIQCWLLSGVTSDRPWATYLELQSDLQSVSVSARTGCSWEGPSCTPRLFSTSTDPGGRSAKGPNFLENCIHGLAV